MEITGTTGTPASRSDSRTAGALTSDFETFLKMLTAQARYQDPLEPIDSTEYAAQLAQFSMVEQQVQTNDRLAALFDQSATFNVAGLSGWIGRDVRVSAPAYFDGAPILVSPNPAAVADRVELVVTDEIGAVVQRMPIPVSAEPVEWSGIDAGGLPFASGRYSFTVDSYQGEELLLSEPAEIYAPVVEAQVLNGDVVLVLRGGGAVPASAVTALREGT